MHNNVCLIPENPVFSLRYGDRILFFYLAFVPDTICFLKKFLKNFSDPFFGFCTGTNCEERKNNYLFETDITTIPFHHLYKVLNSSKKFTLDK